MSSCQTMSCACHPGMELHGVSTLEKLLNPGMYRSSLPQSVVARSLTDIKSEYIPSNVAVAMSRKNSLSDSLIPSPRSGTFVGNSIEAAHIIPQVTINGIQHSPEHYNGSYSTYRRLHQRHSAQASMSPSRASPVDDHQSFDSKSPTTMFPRHHDQHHHQHYSSEHDLHPLHQQHLDHHHRLSPDYPTSRHPSPHRPSIDHLNMSRNGSSPNSSYLYSPYPSRKSSIGSVSSNSSDISNNNDRMSPPPTLELSSSKGISQSPEQPARVYNKTLQNVLNGHIPAGYSHWTKTLSPRRSPPSCTSPRIPSPVSVRSPITASRPASSGSKRSFSEIEQLEPMDLSCKRLCDTPPEERKENCKLDGSASPDLASQPTTAPSLLRNLLCVGKEIRNNMSPDRLNFRRTEDNKSTDSFLSETHSTSSSSSSEKEFCGKEVSSNTPVYVAKKNLLPVTARVSDWLVKIVRFAKSIPEFSTLPHNDKLALVLNGWARLLLVYMAENNFQFAVSLNPSSVKDDGYGSGIAPATEEPTVRSVEAIQNFIRKCQNLNIDSKEYSLLRMAVLFNAGIRGLDRPEVVDGLNTSVQQLLHEHAQVTRPSEVMHYSRLLMSLPSLYGINCEMVQNLFCRHINGNLDMEVLLKEMLQNL